MVVIDQFKYENGQKLGCFINKKSNYFIPENVHFHTKKNQLLVSVSDDKNKSNTTCHTEALSSASSVIVESKKNQPKYNKYLVLYNDQFSDEMCQKLGCFINKKSNYFIPENDTFHQNKNTTDLL